MMRGSTVVAFLAFVGCAHAQDISDIDTMLNRLYKKSPNDSVDVDQSTLGKPANIAALPQRGNVNAFSAHAPVHSTPVSKPPPMAHNLPSFAAHTQVADWRSKVLDGHQKQPMTPSQAQVADWRSKVLDSHPQAQDLQMDETLAAAFGSLLMGDLMGQASEELISKLQAQGADGTHCGEIVAGIGDQVLTIEPFCASKLTPATAETPATKAAEATTAAAATAAATTAAAATAAGIKQGRLCQKDTLSSPWEEFTRVDSPKGFGLKTGDMFIMADEDGSVTKTSGFNGAWEEFGEVPSPKGFGIKTTHGTYLSARNDGSIHQAPDFNGAWEEFQRVPSGNGFGLKTSHGKFVSAHPDCA
eukprot:gnl/TRDRNA2_/TRDRNA2_51515_c0_seq1.p1 gnl/TRDRNA2_/TRDRNA2_51515_c0~~gnl/TRDRNA2_/TRDRNA2_51515_c0_seq1.p1  ORF type:complete len:358 (+),score=80.80 gnl/TRDRNA2_/TRDRNA2_51515_c0_seq1:62-1135(+)